MTLYAGESVRVTNQATDFNGEVLTPTDVTSVTVTIYKSGAPVVATTGMTWDADAIDDKSGLAGLWYFDWDSGDADPGSYEAKCVVTGPGSRVSWEIKKIRLSRSPV